MLIPGIGVWARQQIVENAPLISAGRTASHQGVARLKVLTRNPEHS